MLFKHLVNVMSNTATETNSTVNQYSHRALHNAITNSDWDFARNYLDQHEDALSAPLSSTGTALHIAILSEEFGFARELIDRMSNEELEIRNRPGYTALHLVAMVKSKSLADVMMARNSNLIKISRESELPVTLAAKQDNNHDMALHLYKKTPSGMLDPDQNADLGVVLFCYCIFTGHLDIALDLIERFPKLALSKSSRGHTTLGQLACRPSYFRSGNRFTFWQRWIFSRMHVPPPMASSILDEDVSTAHQRGSNANGPNRDLGVLWNLLKVFGGDDIYRRKVKHVLACKILDAIIKEISTLSYPHFRDLNGLGSLIVATRHGIIEIVAAIIKAHPNILVCTDNEGISPLMHAIIHRQEKIMGLIHQFRGYKYWASAIQDKKKNTLLHKTGELAPGYQLERVSGAALQFQRERQWFQEVENIIPSIYHCNKNVDDKTAHQLFVEKHRELKKEGEKWLKEIATSNTVVATLIITIMFSAVYTLPGGNNESTGAPIFEHRNSFVVFMVSDAFSLFFSITSLLIFLGILTSRFAEEDFLESLPRKLILGLSSLFLSLASMMVAFGCTLDIVLRHRVPWILAPIILLTGVPIVTFVSLQFPLLVQIFISTYGPSIFERPKKHRR